MSETTEQRRAEFLASLEEEIKLAINGVMGDFPTFVKQISTKLREDQIVTVFGAATLALIQDYQKVNKNA